MANRSKKQSPEEFLEHILGRALQEAGVRPGDALLAAVSGGADSMALLDGLCRLAQAGGWTVAAAHVHHGLRGPEADRDETFVADQCRLRGVPLFRLRADVAAQAKAHGEGLEEAGRRVRYAFFERLMEEEGFSFVLTAHTASDNLETLLLHLARGCGVAGLCGIPPRRGRILRPLLGCTREDIEEYCAVRQIPFVTDSTNGDRAYRRNRVRQEVIPALREVNPRLEEAAARLIRSAARDEDCLQEQAAWLLGQAETQDGVRRELLRQAHPAVRLRALARLARSFGGDPEEGHLLELERLLFEDGGVSLPGGIQIRTCGEYLQEGCEEAHSVPFWKYTLRPGDSCDICGRKYRLDWISLEEYEKKKKIHKNLLKNAINYVKISGSIVVRQRLPGDAYRPAGRGGTKSLKKLFQEARIPVSERGKLPVLCDDQGILLAGDFGCDERVKPDLGSAQQLLWFHPTDQTAQAETLS